MVKKKKRRKEKLVKSEKKKTNKNLVIIALGIIIVGIGYVILGPKETGIQFYDVRLQTPEFIDYHNSITLTPEQEKIKSDALSSIHAPCCADYPMSTCCCPCNLAKSVWGLSNFLIVEHNYNAEQVKEEVSRWIRFTNKRGYAGNACYIDRCYFPFREDGCGGMEELIL
jgi:hypothetical protein